MPKLIANPLQQGQALLDIVITTGLFLLLVHAAFSLIIMIYDSLGYAQTRLIARHLATEKLETLVNMPYNQLGTTSGIPHGSIPEFEKINRNGLEFEVHTAITYIDDAFDNKAPTDLLPTDYKQLRIEVTWGGQFSSRAQPLVLVTNIAPRGLESAVAGGTLSVFVINALGQPVSQAQVHITNTSVNPQINVNLQTNTDGRLVLPGAPVCATCYHVEVTKTGYTSDKTYTTTEVANPDKRPLTITNQTVTEGAFVIDKVSTLKLHTYGSREQNFPDLGNFPVRLTGSRRIGTDVDGDPVYKYDQVVTTDPLGQLTILNMGWDSYIVSLTNTSYRIAGSNPHVPFTLKPDQTLNFLVTLVNNSTNNLLLTVNDATSSAIASASAILQLAPNFIATKSSGLVTDPDFGQAYFGNLQLGTYNYTINHSQYQTNTGTIIINGPTTDTIVLNPK